MRRSILTAALVACGAASQACSHEPGPAPPAGEETMQQTSMGVGDLPFAAGLTFATLNDYLDHLRRRGAYDVPWFREVSPGVYERVAGGARPKQPPQRFTRAELEQRFGFTR